MIRELTCIVCPKGCQLRVELDENKNILSVSGHTCKRGEVYAISECTNPQRSITSTVRVSNRENVMVSVKTKDTVSKNKIFEVMKVIRSLSVEAPLEIGDELCDNVAGTKIIATKKVE